MVNRTQIIVTNLPADIASRFGGNTSVALDLPVDFSLRLSKDVGALSVLNTIKVEGILGSSLPFSPTNDAIFGAYATPLTLDNTTVFYTVQIIVEGNGLQFDRLQIKGKNDQSKTWDVEYSRRPDHWVELSQQLKTNELDYSSFTMGKTFIQGNWTTPAYNGDHTTPSSGQAPYYFPLVDYGGWVDQTEVPQGAVGRYKSVAVEDFRPWLSFRYILQAGFCAIGWTLESILFDMDAIRRLWIYNLRPDYYIASDRGGRIIGRNYADYEYATSSPALNYLRFSDLVKGLVGSFIANGSNRYLAIRNVTGVALKYKFFMKGDFFNDRALSFSAYFAVMEMEADGFGGYDFTGEVLSEEPYLVEFAAGETKNVTFEDTIVLKAGQIGAIHINVLPSSGFKVLKGLYFSVVPDNQSLFTDDIFDVAECVSDEYSILDWLKAFVHLVNGRLSTDWETRTVTIHPNRTSDVFGETAPGFLLRENPIINLEELVVKDSIKISPVRPDLKRYTQFQFKKSTDAYIQSLNLYEPALSRRLLNSYDLPDGVEAIANPVVEPTLEGIPNDLSSGSGGRQPIPYLPRLWDNLEGNRSFNIGPRILYAYDSVRQINPSPITATNEFTSFFFDEYPNPGNTGLQEEFGYASQKPTWALTPTPTVTPNITFGSDGVDLFTIFYLGYTQEARSGNLVDLLLRMSLTNYLGYNFRDLYRFRYRGIPIVAPMLGIRDFQSGNSDIPTPVQFFVEPAVTDCCDLPCGCQFSTCDYYQDFGPYLRQTTLGSMLISSFIVDGIELLTSPVSLGLINIIDIGGRPYVTNLVDTLNSIGAPYFAFGYSTRLHPEKGLRFFTLKRLSCVPFSITITVSGADAYLYTQDVQGQAIFQVGFDDMGYGTEFLAAPDNCVITTEY